jgi:prolyl oligopeptidase
VVAIHDLKSGAFIKDLPVEIGSIDSLSGRKQDTTMFFKLSSFLNPGVINRYDFGATESADRLSVFRQTKLNAAGFDSLNFETKQVFYPSKDGTKIPMFIVSNKVS